MPDQPHPESRRHWLRISIRGLIILVLIGGGWLGWVVRSARIQRRAVEAIVKAGGAVKYDWEYQDGRTVPNGQPWWPRWLVDRLGVDYFGRVVLADLSRRRAGAEATDEVLTFVRDLDRLEVSNLYGSSVSDAGLTALERLTNLQELTLCNKQVTDTGLAHLKRLTGMRRLTLSNTKLTGAGLVNLRGLVQLRSFSLIQTPLGVAGLEHLTGLTDLEVLDLPSTGVTDAGLEHCDWNAGAGRPTMSRWAGILSRCPPHAGTRPKIMEERSKTSINVAAYM